MLQSGPQSLSASTISFSVLCIALCLCLQPPLTSPRPCTFLQLLPVILLSPSTHLFPFLIGPVVTCLTPHTPHLQIIPSSATQYFHCSLPDCYISMYFMLCSLTSVSVFCSPVVPGTCYLPILGFACSLDFLFSPCRICLPVWTDFSGFDPRLPYPPASFCTSNLWVKSLNCIRLYPCIPVTLLPPAMTINPFPKPDLMAEERAKQIFLHRWIHHYTVLCLYEEWSVIYSSSTHLSELILS